MSEDNLLRDFPDLKREDILATLAFAAARERRLEHSPASMKLLFDENVSPRLAAMLADPFPDSTHVRTVNLRGAEDSRIWEFARGGEYPIVQRRGLSGAQLS